MAKILVIGKGPLIQGGAGVCTWQTAIALANSGCHVDFLTDANEVESTMRLHGVPNKHTKEPNIVFPSPIGRFEHFPASNLRSERLVGCALGLVKKSRYDLIVGWYLMPYAMVAVDVASRFGIKCAVIHGGSDIMTLSHHADLRHAIHGILSRATVVVTASRKEVQRQLVRLGAKVDSLRPVPHALPLPLYHRERKIVSEYYCIFQNVCRDIGDTFDGDEELLDLWRTCMKIKDFCGPVIVMYGKVSKGKRSFEAVEALIEMADRGLKFGFIGVFTGGRENVLEVLRKVAGSSTLLDRSVIFPGLRAEFMPSILSVADIGLALEDGFGISSHQSILPREMFAAGLAVAMSEGIAERPFFKWIAHDGLNVHLIRRGFMFDDLLRLIQSADLLKSLKDGSVVTSKVLEREIGEVNPIVGVVAELVDVA